LLDNNIKNELVNHLYGYISENKRNLIEKISACRTRFLTLVLEDIEESKDASAVIRTCDIFGIQEINIVENNNRYRINPDVTMGSSKWVDIINYKKPAVNNTLDCIAGLKSRGYSIIAMTPAPSSKSLEDLQINNKMALMFGSEENGLSETALNEADLMVKIPSYGFTESYTISVSAAIAVHYLRGKLLKKGIQLYLSGDELLDLKLKWIKKVIKKGEMLEKKFIERKNST
jgi:tRNA (guanosine-2'-O-)-methyltransferase